jgi:hypothetical protein
MKYKKYTIVEVRKFMEGRMQGSSYEEKGHSFSSRIDAYGMSSVRMYQINKDPRTGLEYIVIGIRIIEDEVA